MTAKQVLDHRVSFTHRRYGRTMFTWADVEIDGTPVSLGDPVPGPTWTDAELERAVKHIITRRRLPAGDALETAMVRLNELQPWAGASAQHLEPYLAISLEVEADGFVRTSYTTQTLSERPGRLLIPSGMDVDAVDHAFREFISDLIHREQEPA